MAPRDPQLSWTVVIPVRDPSTGKSRLRAGTSVNAAIARDTLAAALACRRVARVVVVTDRASWIDEGLRSEPRFEAVLQRAPGLTAAVSEGLAVAGAGEAAVMLGDLPALVPEDLEQALTAASLVRLGMVTDHCGTGTTLITARSTADHRPRFGEGSAAEHRRLGYEELPLPAGSTLRRDVDTPEDLDAALSRGAGPATLRALEESGAFAQ